MCAPCSVALLLPALFLAAALLAAAQQQIEYKERVNLSQTATLRFSVVEDKVHLALNVSGFPMEPEQWLGLGIGEPTSGGLLGSDLFVVKFDERNQTCFRSDSNDRHVPFTAFPVNREPVIEFRPDSAENLRTWELRGCRRESNTALLEVSHLLEPKSTFPEDRPIRAGTQEVVHAFGPNLNSFVQNRNSSEVTFFNADRSKLIQDRPTPHDWSGSLTFSSQDIEEPHNFSCFATPAPQSREGRMVVAVDVNVSSPAVRRVVIYGCENSEFFTDFNGTEVCNWKTVPLVIGLAPKARCNTVFYAWAPVMGRLLFPKEAGILLDSKIEMLVMEIHIDRTSAPYNAGAVQVEIHYTDKRRKYNAGTLAFGDAGYFFENDQVNTGRASVFNCPSECTNFFNSSINIFASHLHLGLHGRSILLRKQNAKSFNSSTFHEIQYWSYGLQKYHYFPNPVVINPGDSVTAECNYNTSKAPGQVLFGRRSIDEACMAYVHFWPAQERSEGDGSLFYCSRAFTRAGRLGPLCGAGYRSDRLLLPDASAVCFPGSAVVRLEDGSQREMRALRLGDRVLVADSVYSEVFMFTHRDAATEATFVHIGLARGRGVALTPGHFLYVNGKLAPAGSVRVGDALHDATGNPVRALSVARIRMRGLYNPQTLHGDIVVNDVRASTYTTAVAPAAAHALLAPLRGVAGWLAAFFSNRMDGWSSFRDFGIRCFSVFSAVVS